MEKQNQKIKLVYIGPCTTVDKKVGCVFVPLTSEQYDALRLPEDLPKEYIYGGDLPKLVGRPGAIYEFEYQENSESSAIFPHTRNWLGFLENDPRVVQWQAKHDAFFAGKQLAKQEANGKNTNLVHKQLAPLKVAYNKMVGHQRAVFLAQIIGYVTGRVTKKDTSLADRTSHDDDDED